MLLVALAGCGISAAHYTAGDDAATGDDDATGDDVSIPGHSGSRLSLVHIAFDDSSIPTSIHDTVLDSDCIELAWNDGSSYCTPPGTGVDYADSNCTIPVIPAAPSDPTTVFGREMTPDGAAVTHLYRAGGTTTLSMIYSSFGGNCVGLMGTVVVYEVQGEVQPGQLVGLTSSYDASPLSYRYVHGADGLLGITQDVMRDNTLQSDCYVGVQGSGFPTQYCVPQDGFTDEFSDPTCTTPMVTTAGGSPPRYAAPFPGPDKCFEISTVNAVGSAFAPTQVYGRDASGGCIASAPTAGTYYQTASQATPLPPLVHHAANQPTRRIENATRAVGSLVFGDGDFFDTQLATWCFARVQPDGTYLCEPEGNYTQLLYDDAACSHAVLVIAFDPRARRCGFPIPPYAVETVGTVDKIHPVMQTRLDALYSKGTTCVAVDSTFEYYPVGDPLPQTMLATGMRVIEPTRQQ